MSAEEKFNTIMPESDHRTLCIEVDKPISKDGYEQNFLPKLEALLEKNEKARVLVYFKHYKGWEMGAAVKDLGALGKYGKKLEKLAFVNPPEKEVILAAMRESMIGGETRLFNEEDLQEAIAWAKAS